MRKHMFRITVFLLVIVLGVVSFYMLYVHVPHYQYYHQLDEVRNDICETNHYEYLNYFYEYHGKEPYYILKVKIDNVESYVAYNKKKELVNTLQGEVADSSQVIDSIEKKYQIKIKELEVGYEDNKFVYYAQYQDENSLMYIYYDLVSGEFVKAVKLGESSNG